MKNRKKVFYIIYNTLKIPKDKIEIENITQGDIFV